VRASSPAAAGAALAFLDGAELAGIGPEWDELWRRCGATPFQHPAWLLPWARRYAPGRAGAAALRIGGRLQGLAPVFAWQGALMLAGTRPSDRGDWLLAPEARAQAGALLAAMAAAPLGRFARIELRQLPPGSMLARAAAPPGWREVCGEDEPCLVAPLSGEDGLAAVSAGCRSNWRYAMRRIGREGGEVELVPQDGVTDAMAQLARLHARRWQARGESGVLADPLLDGLLRDAAPGLAAAGLLRLWRLRRRGAAVAVLLVLAGRGAHAYFIGGFDPAAARLSPSSALIGAAMAQAAREGAKRFDFLRGDEPYKARWGAAPQPSLRRTLWREFSGE
jgi:CelD/BcsL family acetyltransferase involved in cellulose biosynthesis